MASQLAEALVADEDDAPSEQSAARGPAIRSHVGNAAVEGDSYAWHVDMDPACLFFDAPWAERHGCYVNRELGKPWLVSMLLYPDEAWDEAWGAETLFADDGDDGESIKNVVATRVLPARLVLMDQ
eukprot:CAMPEP_0119176338 /NCGR_PEP_ID=MMETSP1315-20130426/45176_1 /TAXON_ID=676789 /ORGANISM="Prasinoderma singularis, Strain RCC927" /LENGTH=125 /DNA_ID=CAMNT_0007170443 /DNA_START=1 /DNA_END=375 /DNA_ORIENTATION=+